MTKRSRVTAGFTLTEVVVVGMIIVILAGLVGINVVNYQRSLYFLEQESIAKEIFIAAQNHLAIADSQGLLNQKNAEGEDTYAPGATAGSVAEGNDIFYFVHNPGDNTLTTSNVLKLMLPEYSLDATVRLGGSYIIRYQRTTAQVIDVFFASPQGSTFGHRYGYTLTSADVTAAEDFFEKYAGDKNKESRLKYPNGTGDYVIGWYGANAGDVAKGEELNAPEVIINNAERLTVTVINHNSNGSGTESSAQLKLVVTGKESKAVKVFELIDKDYVIPQSAKGDAGYLPATHIDKSTFTLVFDDITSSKHFAKVFENADSGTFKPGEDLRIEAVAFDNNKIVRVAKSGEKTTNSLFASLKVTRTDSGTESIISASTARVANIRHLENLDKSISNVANSDLKIGDVEQIRNIYWTDNSWSSDTTVYQSAEKFAESLKGFKEIILAQTYLTANSTASVDNLKGALNGDIQIYDKSGTTKATTEKNAYAPVQLESKIVYNGKLHFIANVTAKEPRDAGLFSKLQNNSKVKNLELRDFNITSTENNAGALAGSTEGAEISGVFARNTRANDASLTISATDSSTGKSAGGLVGEITGGSVALSAAAVRVVSTAGDAGGLLGKITGNTLVTISKSYSGGHTKNGTYYEESNRKLQPIYNVQAPKAHAGGLIGTAENAAITSCYSTCSAQGKTSVGGLVGTISKGSVNNSYATGLVGITEGSTGDIGCFVGTLVSGVTLGTNASANSYFSLVNLYDANGVARTVSVIGNDTSNTAVSAFDATVTTYNAFVSGSSVAYPYDTYLISKGASTYPLKNIKVLSGDTSSDLPKHATMHYGDWPAPEVLVVNEPNA